MAEYDRFRSFAERYVIERASTFTRGKERDEAWEAILDAKTVYRSIELVSHEAEPVHEAAQAGPPGNGMSSAAHPGVTAAHRLAAPWHSPPGPSTNIPSVLPNQKPPPLGGGHPQSDPSTLQKLHQRLMGAIGKGP